MTERTQHYHRCPTCEWSWTCYASTCDPQEQCEDCAPTPRTLTRQERLQALADAGCDTLEEYRGEK